MLIRLSSLIIGCCLLFVLFACRDGAQVSESADEHQTRPNIVILLGDDHTGRDIGAYGNPDVITPNIDDLSREGINFRRAFTSTAMCSPTRHQLYTGLFPIRSGAFPNHGISYPGTRSIAHYFQAMGYRVGITGKLHVGPDESFPWEFVGERPDDPVLQRTPLNLDAANEFIRRDDRPFLLIVAEYLPHFPWRDGDAEQYDADSLTTPEYLVDTAETRAALVKYYAEVSALDDTLGSINRMLIEAGKMDDTLTIYTSEQGSLFRAKATLYDTGLKTAFIARWPGRIAPGDHDAMVQYVDVLPTLVEMAGGEPPQDIDGKSFYRAFVDPDYQHRDYVYGVHTTMGNVTAANYPIRSIRTGRYKLILNLNADKGEFRHQVIKANTGGFYWSWGEKGAAGDADAAHKYAFFKTRPAVELYDVLEDPDEIHNLAGQAEYQDIEQQLTTKLLAWMRQQQDKGIETEAQAFSRFPPGKLTRAKERGWFDQ